MCFILCLLVACFVAIKTISLHLLHSCTEALSTKLQPFNDTRPWRKKRKGVFWVGGGVVIGVISSYYINICSYITGIVSSACVSHSALKACSQKQSGAFFFVASIQESFLPSKPDYQAVPLWGTCWETHIQVKGIIARGFLPSAGQ